MSPHCILHLDVDAFFAAVEQRDDPKLRGLPVAVGTGVVASCSYESRRWGVRTGMRLSDARRMCRSLIVLPGDYRRYDLASRPIVDICLERTPWVEKAALDDLYLDLAPRNVDQAVGVAREIALRVRSEVGLRVSLGLGTNRLVAAVATCSVKERKARFPEQEEDLAIVPAGGEQAYLAPWPVEVLPGVGPKATRRLAQLNVRRVHQLAEMPLAVLAGLFGARGTALRQLARGVDSRPVMPDRRAQSISRCTSFDPPVGDGTILTAMLDYLVDRAATSLRRQDQAARGLIVQLRYADQRWVDGRSAFARPTQEESALKAAARDRLRRLYTRALPLRLIGVELSPLCAPDPQGELFPDPEQLRRCRLQQCKDNIRDRFGFLALTSGTALTLQENFEHDRDNFHLRTPCLTR